MLSLAAENIYWSINMLKQCNEEEKKSSNELSSHILILVQNINGNTIWNLNALSIHNISFIPMASWFFDSNRVLWQFILVQKIIFISNAWKDSLSESARNKFTYGSDAKQKRAMFVWL